MARYMIVLFQKKRMTSFRIPLGEKKLSVKPCDTSLHIGIVPERRTRFSVNSIFQNTQCEGLDPKSRCQEHLDLFQAELQVGRPHLNINQFVLSFQCIWPSTFGPWVNFSLDFVHFEHVTPTEFVLKD